MTVTVPINTTPAPSRLDTTNFATRADAYHAWLPTAVAAMNAQNVENNTLTAAATTASASAVSAAAVVTANNPITNAAAAAASATAAAASALASATSTSAASAAKDAAIAAWAASTAPTEQLSAISKSLHLGTVVKSIIYDTAKDSDGGAWRKRCADKSWYNEALGGSTWLGQQPSEAVARAYFGSLASSNLITNGTFGTDTSGWTAGGGGATISVVSGALRVTSDSTGTVAGYAYQTFTTVIGKSYYLTLQVTAGTASDQRFRVGSTGANTNQYGEQAGTGLKTFTFVATTTTATVSVGQNVLTASVYSDFDNISVKPVDSSIDTSNYLYQSTVDGKFYRTNGNLLPDTSNLFNQWSTDTSATRNSVSVAAPDGSTTVVQLVSASGSTPYVYTNPTVVSGNVYTYSAYIKLGTGGDGTVRLDNTTRGASATFNLSTGALSTTTNCTSTITSLGNGWYRCSMTYTATSSAANTHDIVLLGTFTTGQGHYLWGAQLELGSTMQSYKPVTTTYTGPQTEVFRGITREFPAVVAIVAEASRVVIYDLTVSSCPMWMVFLDGVGGYFAASNSSIAVVNGTLAVSQNDRTVQVYFLRDTGSRTHATASNYYATNIASRNSTLIMGSVLYSSYTPGGSHNDVAITVLDTSPIDPATGLPVPTIAVATAGGVSVIKDDGTVVNSSQTERTDSLGFVGSTLFMGNRYATTDTFRFQELSSISASWTPTSGMGYLFSGGAEDQATILPTAPYVFHRLGTAFTLNKVNKALPSRSMRARVTNAYNSGWQVGDSRLAALADTTAETITDGTSTELVTNGTFTTDTTGWAAANATLSSVSSALRITATGASSATAFQSISGLSVGRIYSVSVTFAAGTTGLGSLSLGLGSVNGADYLTTSLSVGVNTFTFKATGTTLGVTLSNDSGSTGLYSTFDNVSCKLINELIANGTFGTDTGGWTAASVAASTASSVGGEAQITATVGYGRQIQTVTCVVGKTYVLSGSVRTISGTSRASLGYTTNSTGASAVVAGNNLTSTATIVSINFTASQTSMYVVIGDDANIAGGVMGFDNISVKLADPDRSVKNTGLVLNGSLTKTAVASGAGLVAYSGFSASNYLSQPFSLNLNFGTGDWCVMGWGRSDTVAGSTQTFFSLAGASTHIRIGRATSSGVTYPLTPYVTTAGVLGTIGVTGNTAGFPAMSVGIWMHFCVLRSGSTLYIYVNGVLAYSVACAGLDLTSTDAVLTLGAGFTTTTYEVSMALWRVGAIAPTADQIAHIYKTELPLFQANAQCTLAGTSTSVTALSYDAPTDTLHAGTSWGRSSFRDLLRTDSEATTTGSITSLSSNYGSILTGGTSSKVYVPSLLLRDEIAKPNPVASQPQPYRQWSIKDQQVFSSQTGVKIVGVYIRGVLKKLGIDYTVAYDGFRYVVTTTDKLASRTEVTFLQIKE